MARTDILSQKTSNEYTNYYYIDLPQKKKTVTRAQRFQYGKYKFYTIYFNEHRE